MPRKVVMGREYLVSDLLDWLERAKNLKRSDVCNVNLSAQVGEPMKVMVEFYVNDPDEIKPPPVS